MKIRNLLLGLGAGIAAGYVGARALEAVRERREPSEPREKDAIAYASTRRALEVADAARSIAGLLSFAYGPLGEVSDRFTMRAPVWARPGLYVAALSVVSAVVEFPVSFVEDYTLERQFALSEQSRNAWVSDYVKSTLLTTGMSAFVATLFGAAVRRAPRTWPFLASMGTLPLFILANLIVPLYVLPLFNKFDPVTGPLEKRLRALAARFGVGDAEILRMDMSRQTRKANAFVTGIGETHRIVLGDTLIDAFPENEIEFVVAHELGHYVSKDTWRTIALAETLAITLFFIANATTSRAERDSLRDRPLLITRLYANMVVAMQALRPLLFAFSRSREWAADRFARAATRDPQSGAAAFRRLRDQNLADEDPPHWYEIFFSSHPSLKERIAALSTSTE